LKDIEEMLKINIELGWKKGTKVIFLGLVNDVPGSPPSDLSSVVIERPHALFKMGGNDLIMTQKISLLETLVEKTLNLTILDGRDITIHVTDIVTPCYQKVVYGDVVPLSKDPSKGE
jgi:DnaJ homolog subfamily B member 4